MEINTIIEAFINGGWGLVLFLIAVYGIKFIYTKLSAQFITLNKKVDELREDVTSLKVDNAKWTTAIRQCSHSDCPTKKLLEEKK